jgi:hypothetical protein
LASGSSDSKSTEGVGPGKFEFQPSTTSLWLISALALLQLLCTISVFAQSSPAAAQLNGRSPNAAVSKAQAESPCQIKRDGVAFQQAAAAGVIAPNPSNPPLRPDLQPSPCPPLAPLIDWYARFLTGPQVKALTPREKGMLAIRNFADPFNAITIAGNSAIYIGANSHSWYGPGMAGWAKNVGISYSEDGIGEFFGTFLIPSLAHQDPHYHRMPERGVPHRILHAMTQVGWTQGDDGRKYAQLCKSPGLRYRRPAR